jgi:hypothetical protein
MDRKPARTVTREVYTFADGPLAGEVERCVTNEIGVVAIRHGGDGCWLHTYRIVGGEMRHDKSTTINLRAA